MQHPTCPDMTRYAELVCVLAAWLGLVRALIPGVMNSLPSLHLFAVAREPPLVEIEYARVAAGTAAFLRQRRRRFAGRQAIDNLHFRFSGKGYKG